MKGIKETNTITTISSSEEEESAVAGYISEDCLSVIDEGETVGRRLQNGWMTPFDIGTLSFILLACACAPTFHVTNYPIALCLHKKWVK